jgi:hypothetical protein
MLVFYLTSHVVSLLSLKLVVSFRGGWKKLGSFVRWVLPASVHLERGALSVRKHEEPSVRRRRNDQRGKVMEKQRLSSVIRPDDGQLYKTRNYCNAYDDNAKVEKEECREVDPDFIFCRVGHLCFESYWSNQFLQTSAFSTVLGFRF